MNDIGELSRGKSKHRPRNDDILYTNGTVPLIQTGDIASADKYISQYNVCYNNKGVAQSRLWKKGTLCITITANIGDVAILGFDACFPDSVLGFLPFSNKINIEYIYFMLVAYKNRMNNKASKVAQSNLSLNKINSMYFPFPPLEEQERIVERVNAIMEQIDEYEKIEQELVQLKANLPGDMRAAILQAAMQGKLTKQLESDSSVEEMLEKIKKEKQEIIEKGELRCMKEPSYVDNNDIPFDIPENWLWVTLPMIAQSCLGKTLNKHTDIGVTKPYLCSINVYTTGINLDTIKKALFSQSDIKKYRLKKYDLLICEGGDTGRSCVWENDTEMYYQNALHRVRFFSDITPYFYNYVMLLYKFNGLYSMPLPLPPIEEQQRIVERLDELLPICENLM